MEINKLKQTKPFYSDGQSLFWVNNESVEFPHSMPHSHYHSSYEIYYLLSGERYYFIKDKLFHIKKGDIVLIPPYEIHATINSENKGYERSLFTFKKDFLEEEFERFSDINFTKCFEQGLYVISLDPQEQIIMEEMFDRLIKYYYNEETEKIKLTVMNFLMQINSKETSVRTDKINDIPIVQKTVSDIMGYINSNYKDNLSLDEVSKRFFISPCYLSRNFKKSSGLSFVDYVNNVRIKEAKRLLAETDETVLEVAEKTGFMSNTHFGRTFKKICGISPLEFKINHRKEKIK